MLPERALPPALLSLILVVSEAAAVPFRPRDTLLHKRAPASFTPPRNDARFPYDIAGVVGGYVVAVLIWSVLLLTFGRRMRRKALEPPKALELETQNRHIKPSARTAPLGSPPLSARSASSWLKKFKKTDSAVPSPHSPVVASPTSFDQKVIDAHNARAQEDLERLYAAVMDHDAQKESSPSSNISVHDPDTNTKDRRRPSAISTSHTQVADASPISPVKAIYPPGYPSAPRTAPLSQQPPASPRSSTSQPKSTRFNLKNLRISGPAHKYPGIHSEDDAHTPLTPKFAPQSQTASPTTPAHERPLPLPRERLSSQSSITSNPLPLRSFATPLHSPGIQTTVLDRRNERLALGTPRTGVPFTPYSPYMPFTPVTPVTPHLVGRKERRERERREGRGRVQEVVGSEREIWGSGY